MLGFVVRGSKGVRVCRICKEQARRRGRLGCEGEPQKKGENTLKQADKKGIARTKYRRLRTKGNEGCTGGDGSQPDMGAQGEI